MHSGCGSPRRITVETIARNLLAGREPYTLQRFHARDQAIQHSDAQSAPGYEGMQADVEIAPTPILLLEARPPHVEHAIRIAKALLAVAARQPREAEEHGIVDGVV